MYGQLPSFTTETGDTIHGFPVQIRNPHKTCLLRLPTTDELLAYFAVQYSLVRPIGRGQSLSEDVPTPAADRKLFDACRLDKNGQPFDDAEILYALALLNRHKAVSCERDGEEYVVEIQTLFGLTTHRLSIPFQVDMIDYQRKSYVATDLPRGVTKQKFPVEPSVRLYDKVIQAVTGYGTDTDGDGDPSDTILLRSMACSIVPPNHKKTAVSELTRALDSLDPSLDPNF